MSRRKFTAISLEQHPHSTALPALHRKGLVQNRTHAFRADGGIRTHGLLITNQLL